MYHSDISEEVRVIEDALKGRTDSTITGGQLLSLINSVAPNMNVRSVVGIIKGPGALTEFVNRYLSHVIEKVGNQGGDNLFGIIGRTVDSPRQNPISEIWRVFVSPSSPQHLVVSRATRQILTRYTPASSADNEVEVAKATAAEHDKMRADFVATLSSTEAETLHRHVAADSEFASWIEVMRAHLPDATRRWGQYRRRILAQIFSARITDLGLEQSLQDSVLTQIKAAEHSVYERPRAEAVVVGNNVSQGSKSKVDGSSQARKLAHAVIDLLPYEELRALKIPLGVVLDVIQADA